MSYNLQAFLDTIARSEGTSAIVESDNGYNVIVGGHLFHDYSTHPDILVKLPSGISSTAAGRYQLLYRYYVAYKSMLDLPDFSPASQDAIAIQQIKEQGALPDIEDGDFDTAAHKVRNIWASFPDNEYGQHQNDMDKLTAWYTAFGGKINA